MHLSVIQRLLLHLDRAKDIARRYFVTNGFDAALTMLGLLVGFYTAENVPLDIAIKACMGAAVALGMSGLSSTYLSETAERKRELQKLEQALLANLKASDHARASSIVPFMVALVSGLTPFVICLLIISPLWLSANAVTLPVSPYLAGSGTAFLLIFLLGILLGKLSQEFWLWAGIRTLLIALVTAGIILLFN